MSVSDDNSYSASQDIFQDSSPPKNISAEPEPTSKKEVWKGVDLDSLSVLPYEFMPIVEPSASHTVCFKLPLEDGKPPEPFPEEFQDSWDNVHVRMPCSKQNVCHLLDGSGCVPAWPLIKEKLQANIFRTTELQEAIVSYSWKKDYRFGKFIALYQFFSTTIEKAEAEYFFENVLPGVIDLALSIDKELSCKIPLLTRRKSSSITISQRQAACILANAFLCTFPDRSFAKESSQFPTLNFTRIFLQTGKVPQEKLKCMINYFRRVCNSNLDGVITISRRYISPSYLPDWHNSKKKFPLLHVSSEGTIDVNGQGFLQVDFANKYIGGGVLGFGSVQEEIMFLTCPELIVARLFAECMDETECLVITGAEMFNIHTGYADTFKWNGNYEDKLPRDSYRRKCRTIVALDAQHFRSKTSFHQYRPECIFREINKAYCGFSFGWDSKDKMSIATGNWGCGAFNGDPKLKSLLQLIAAAECGRNIAYFTFFDEQLRDDIFNLYSFLIQSNSNVGQVCRALSRFGSYERNVEGVSLYDFLYSSLVKNASLLVGL